MDARQPLVSDKARRIDDDLAGVQLRPQVLGENIERRKIWMLAARHMNADGARQFAVHVEPEQVDVVSVVVKIPERAGGIRRDRAVTHISLVAQAKDRL